MDASEQSWPARAATITLEELDALLEAGVDVNAVDARGRSAATHAAVGRNREVLRRLLAAGADVDAQDRTCLNPFLWACINGDLETARIAVDAGTDLTLTTRFGGVGVTPAAEKGHVELVRWLTTETTINVEHTNSVGWTPLLETIILGDGGPDRVEIVRLLLAAGADPGMVDMWGVTPLEHARQRGFDEIAALIAPPEI